MSPKFSLGKVSEQEFADAGSKFIGIPPGSKKNDIFYRKVEIQALDWDTPDVSMKIETVVTEPTDNGHEEKISFGVDKAGIWKGKTMYKNISGKQMAIVNGHPEPDSDDLVGKAAVGLWQVVEGNKGGNPNAEKILYPKLTDLLPANYNPSAAGAANKGKELGF